MISLIILITLLIRNKDKGKDTEDILKHINAGIEERVKRRGLHK